MPDPTARRGKRFQTSILYARGLIIIARIRLVTDQSSLDLLHCSNDRVSDSQIHSSLGPQPKSRAGMASSPGPRGVFHGSQSVADSGSQEDLLQVVFVSFQPNNWLALTLPAAALSSNYCCDYCHGILVRLASSAQ